jgi:hypothetical protein
MRAMVLSVEPIIIAQKGVGASTGLCGYDALTRSEQIGMNLFAGFNEISHSYDTLLDIEVYVSRFPYANTRITRSGHFDSSLKRTFMNRARCAKG